MEEGPILYMAIIEFSMYGERHDSAEWFSFVFEKDKPYASPYDQAEVYAQGHISNLFDLDQTDFTIDELWLERIVYADGYKVRLEK